VIQRTQSKIEFVWGKNLTIPSSIKFFKICITAYEDFKAV